MSENEPSLPFQDVKTKESHFLRKKDLYEYTTPDNVYDIELFTNQDGTCYAIGIPREGEQLVVYGTNMLPNAQKALAALIQKIDRHGFDRFEPPTE